MRGGALKQPGLAACDEAPFPSGVPHHRRCYMPVAPLLWRPVSSPVHARWCPRGSRKGASSGRTAPPRETADGARMPGRRPGSAAGPEEDEAADGSRRPRALAPPDPGREARAATGLRPLPGPFLPEHCPSFTFRVHDEDTRSPCLFWTL